jgi:hypothetical protein
LQEDPWDFSLSSQFWDGEASPDRLTRVWTSSLRAISGDSAEIEKRIGVMKGSKRAQFELLLATVLVLFVVVRGATVTYDWTVDYAYQSPDCVEKLIISINGQYPGPLVRATVGDTVVVNVVNQIPSEGITIHWHGILQVTYIVTIFDDTVRFAELGRWYWITLSFM